MAIPESQGAIVGSRDTYAAIKKVLESATAPYNGKNYKVFLQGSYGNDTNIYAESDVDVVIRLDDCFHSDRAGLAPAEAVAWDKAHTNATYYYPSFKADVLSVLQKAFPNAITSGDKAFAIKAEGNRRKADVLPCIAYRRYYRNMLLRQSQQSDCELSPTALREFDRQTSVDRWTVEADDTSVKESQVMPHR
jgi:hypothetical protein